MGTVPIDARTLVIPTQQKNVLRILDFIGESQTNRLQGLFSSGDPQKINKRLPLFFFFDVWVPVDVIPEEEIVTIRRISNRIELTQKILVLTVQIADDVDGSCDFEQTRLIEKYLPSRLA